MQTYQSKKTDQYPQPQGFTFIELIVVILILGILAATALPKLIEMRRQARIAALQGMEGAILSALDLSESAFRVSAYTSPLMGNGWRPQGLRRLDNFEIRTLRGTEKLTLFVDFGPHYQLLQDHGNGYEITHFSRISMRSGIPAAWFLYKLMEGDCTSWVDDVDAGEKVAELADYRQNAFVARCPNGMITSYAWGTWSQSPLYPDRGSNSFQAKYYFPPGFPIANGAITYYDPDANDALPHCYVAYKVTDMMYPDSNRDAYMNVELATKDC